MNLNFSVIPGFDIASVLKENANQIQNIIKNAYLLHHQNKTVNPNSYFLRYPDKPHSRIIALPAYVGGNVNVSGIKWIASNPDNIKHGLPRASAVLILNNSETGYPFACLEASMISATRTAASAVLATEYLRKKNKKQIKLGIVGTGLIARYVYNTFLHNHWEIDQVLLHDLNKKYSTQFLKHIAHGKHRLIKIECSIEKLIQASDVIVFTTSAMTPTISNLKLFSHNPVILNISLRDLSPEILIDANNIVDDIEHVLTANTSPHLTAQQYQHRNFINGTLAGYINGEYDLNEKKPCIFSPMGMGILDLALGKFIYDNLKLKKRLINIDNFFSEKR